MAIRGSKVLRQYFSVFRGLPFARLPKIPCLEHEDDHDKSFLKKNVSLQKIAELGNDFVILLKRTGEVDECSLSNKKFHGLDNRNLLDAGFMQLVHIADRPAVLAAFSKAVHAGEEVLVELRMRCQRYENVSEYFCWIELTCSLFESSAFDKEGQGVGEGQVLCLARDISRWKEREAELISREETAHEQIETKTRLLINMSHELRTPLNTIIGFSEMMKLPGITAQNEQQMVEYAGIIFDSGQALLGVVNEVLDMSQFDAEEYKLDPQVFRVSDLVSASVELVQLEATKEHVRFIITGHEDDLQMNADWAACKQALTSLLAAQIKTAAGGQVHLQIKTDSGLVKFVVTAIRQTDADEKLDFSVGTQMQNFINLVSGKLEVTQSSAGRNEVIMDVPQNLCFDNNVSNIVPISHQLEVSLEPLRKTA